MSAAHLHRRSFVAHALAGAAATLGVPATSALAKGAPTGTFAAAVAGQPLLTPFKGVTDLTGDISGDALLRGRWPAELAGRFYRNGPALFERNGERYHHWFDGDGMVQQFTIGAGRVAHRGRLVRTAKLKAEQQAGRFLMSALGTSIEGGPPGSGPDAYNSANTNAIEHAGKVLALWEGGSAYALSPADLSTQGPVTWRPDLQQVPFSAHPKLDASGNLWNIGTQGAVVVVWHINPAGELVRAQVTRSPYPGGMVHDMAVTQRYLVVPLPPVGLDFGAMPANGDTSGPRRFTLKPGEPLRVLVMEKADIQRQRVFELPPEMVFHVGNAHETADGHIVLSYIGAPDTWFLDHNAVALMAGKPSAGGAQATQVLRLNMATGGVQQRSFEGRSEFPRIDPRRIGLPARWLLTAANWQPTQTASTSLTRDASLMHGLQLMDTETGRVRRFDYGAHSVAEEHVLVPKPGLTGELDAWVLGTHFDARRQATVLNLLDAAHLEDGPVAQAVLPYLLPLGFHGNFTPA
jgi:all-trans-8'-apo-beta-carotenal 15,15'-oxygenase